MFLKPLRLFSTSVFTPDFTKLNILRLLGLKVLTKVKLLFFSVFLGWPSSVFYYCADASNHYKWNIFERVFWMNCGAWKRSLCISRFLTQIHPYPTVASFYQNI